MKYSKLLSITEKQQISIVNSEFLFISIKYSKAHINFNTNSQKLKLIKMKYST